MILVSWGLGRRFPCLLQELRGCKKTEWEGRQNSREVFALGEAARAGGREQQAKGRLGPNSDEQLWDSALAPSSLGNLPETLNLTFTLPCTLPSP